VVGAINVASALTPTIRWRSHLLLDFEPVEAMRLLHAIALPTGTALLLVAPYLHKRRRRACEYDADTLVLLARDESDPDRPIRGVLHFVRCYGRSAMSLSFMRRDPGTPNGLTEFMVVQAVELLGQRGIEEMSLNFAAFARWLHSPRQATERALGKVIALGNPFFSDREPVPLQRQVLSPVGAPVPRL
jgi:lysylphosphatidylglycerol synthetase-like protein (DUF2156 family)